MSKRSRRTALRRPGGTRRQPPPPAPRAGRRPPWLVPVAVGGGVLLALVVALVLLIRSASGPAAPTAPAPAAAAGSTPPPAAAASPASGQTVDGIPCETSEQALFHTHAHLAIFADGQARTVPYAIGIKDPQVSSTAQGPFVNRGSCFYWLHSHTADGVIHVESPDKRTFTLGEWFDVWGQPLSANLVGADQGPVTAYVNGQRFTGDPRTIPLSQLAVIQLDVGSDVPPRPYSFGPGL